MRAIETKFGKIYIETLKHNNNCPADREYCDKVRVFDSLERYLDYWEMDTLLDFAENENKTLEEVYQDIIRNYENADSLDAICPDIRFETKDLAKMALFMKIDGGLDIEDRELVAMIFDQNDKGLEDAVLANDYINKIGDWYILVEEN